MSRYSGSLRDRVMWFSQVASLRVPMVKIIDAIQDLPGHFQILSAGLTFYVLCKGCNLSPHEILEMIEKMEQHVDAPFANQFKAMKAYAAGELNE